MRVAALDLGSNSFHVLVADVDAAGRLTRVGSEKEMVRLGAVVGREGRIPADARARALVAIRRLHRFARSYDAQVLVVAATSAIRDAANGPGLVVEAERMLGVPVRVLSGQEEAALVYRALQASGHLDHRPALCLDLGGGSLELLVADVRTLRWAVTVPVGVARLAAELDIGAGPSRSELELLAARVSAALESSREVVRRHGIQRALGTGGTIRSLARVATAGASPVDGAVLSRRYLLALRDDLARMSLRRRRQVPGLDVRRADIAPVGATVVIEAMSLYDLDFVTVAAYGLREGMVLDVHDHPDAYADHSSRWLP